MLDSGPIDPLVEAIELALVQQAKEEERVAQIAALIGHNGGPSLTDLFGIDAPWLSHASEQELARLAKVEARIQRRKRILSETIAERTKIMNRCIRRKRRAAGKN